VKQNNTIRLLFINQSENDAVETNNLLRNSGLILRPKIISNSNAFETEIHNGIYDIILFTDNISDLSLPIVIKKLATIKSDAALIYIGDKTNDEVLQLMKAGVSAVVSEEPEELIELVVKKEVAALRALRNEKQLNKKISDSENRCLQLIDNSRDAIAYLHEGMHILSNDPYYKMFGYESRDDIEVMPIMDLVAPEDSAKLKETLRYYAELESKDHDPQESVQNENTLKVTGLKENGSEFQMKMEFQPATMEGENCIQIIIRNDGLSQKAQQKLQAKLASLNAQCQETGLYNRRYFIEQLKKAVDNAIDHDNNAYLFFISIDKFIEIKKTLGDIESDQIIVDIADLIKNTIKEDISLARFESYKFSAIVKTDDEQHAMQMAEVIRKTVEAHIASASQKSIAITCSIGVMRIDTSNSGTQSCLTHVQKACNIAMQEGGNKIQLHVPDAKEMDDKQLTRYWNNEVSNAIKQKRMFLVFQPVVNLFGEGSEDFEIFIRLRDEQGDTIFPREFLPLTEASGFSLHIDRWIITEAMKILSERIAAGHYNRFIIKLTGVSLSDAKLFPWIKHNLERYKLKPEHVIFQTKVQLAAEHLRHTQHLSKQLHQLGCQFSLEHFGKEANAFALLKHINTDFLKLDSELVQNIATNTENLEKLTEVCTQANEANVKTIAPFIEEPGALSVIWQSGAHYIQGTFLQEPSTSLDFDFSSFS